MPFGKKKSVALVEQDQVERLALEALNKSRATRLQLAVRLEFTAPILMHRWTQKAFVQMAHKMVTGTNLPRGNKDFTEDFNQSWYRTEKGDLALPCRMLKACIVMGALTTDGVVTKADLKRQLRVVGHTALIHMPKGEELRMSTMVASNDGGSQDIRSRAIVPKDSYCDIVLEFSPQLGIDKVMAALTAAGDYIGVCDWRPDTGGEYGTFKVAKVFKTAAERQAIIKACQTPEQEVELPPQLLQAFQAIPEDKLGDKGRKAKSNLEHQRNGHTPDASP